MSRLSSFSVVVTVISTLVGFIIFNIGDSQMILSTSNDCPSGQAPVLDSDGKPVINPETDSAVCKPVDVFGNVFGK